MNVYYLYSRNFDRRYEAVSIRVSASDAEALRAAEHLLARHHTVEVWKDETLVHEPSRQLPVAG